MLDNPEVGRVYSEARANLMNVVSSQPLNFVGHSRRYLRRIGLRMSPGRITAMLAAGLLILGFLPFTKLGSSSTG